ncbi:MAG: CHAP domain-containing protein [Tessaracoccus sp.]|uniref:CHAP domain-containing protein n=1 Tax=Tessaracoccus sp. TaxID=1971211 RepID=UPI001ECEAB18|nr:CHAP domain-containing protein [Tessaracoccus sp.]MBK7820859.1 CHAP domain-containing protein [Tessaracoccus sp.]
MRSSTRRPVTLRAFVALISAALVVGLWGLAAPAEALSRSPKECVGFSTCSKLGYGSSGYSKVYRKSHWGMVGGHNCTNYVAYRLQQAGVKKITKPGRGTAKHWGPAAKAKGIKVSKKNPKVGDVVWWSAKAFRNSTGHVGYVEAVNRKAGTVLVSEDNYRGNYQWRTYKISEVSGFIHVGDDVRNAVKGKTPAITGEPQVGEKLKAKAGAWRPGAVKMTYQWLRDGKKIDGATKSTYEVKKADKDAEITVKVKGAKAGYASTTKTSKAIVAG